MSEKPEDKAKRFGVPLIPADKFEGQKSPFAPIAVCGKCGLELMRTMSYSCPNRNCPCGLGSAS